MRSANIWGIAFAGGFAFVVVASAQSPNDRIDKLLIDSRSHDLIDEFRNFCAGGNASSAMRGLDEAEQITRPEISKLCTTALREDVDNGNGTTMYRGFVPAEIENLVTAQQFQQQLFEATAANQQETSFDNQGKAFPYTIVPAMAYDAAYVEIRQNPEKLSPQVAKANTKLVEQLSATCFSNIFPAVQGNPMIRLCNWAGQKQAQLDMERK